MSYSWIIPTFAVFGALAFTFCVGKYGIVPVYTAVRSWFSSGSAAVSALEARMKALETKGTTTTTVTTGAAPAKPAA